MTPSNRPTAGYVWLMWMPADVALWCAGGVGIAGWLLAARPRPRWAARIAPVLRELAVVLVIYAAWRLLGGVTAMGTGGARQRGLDLWRVERWLHLPNELTLQGWTLHAAWLVRFANSYYIVAHVLPLGVFLVWLFVHHRERYRHGRNLLAVSSLVCQVIQFVPLAPPRLYPELGFVDTGARYGPQVYGSAGFADAGQLAAMPSMHVVWATVIGYVMWKVGRTRWRWLGPAHALLTVFAVTVTAYHWLGDALVAMAIVAACELGARAWSSRSRNAGGDRGAMPSLAAPLSSQRP